VLSHKQLHCIQERRRREYSEGREGRKKEPPFLVEKTKKI